MSTTLSTKVECKLCDITKDFYSEQQRIEIERQTIIEKIKPVLEYNYELIMTRNWTQWSTDQITDLIRH